MERRAAKRSPSKAATDLLTIVRWYFERVYGRWEGPGTVPFYCDPRRVGYFAVGAKQLARASEASLFRLFVTLTMFQARRDVVIMSQQRTMSRADASALTSRDGLLRAIRASPCDRLRSPNEFDKRCTVRKTGGVVNCDHLPLEQCHVKDASTIMLRMGDMGKLPTSALLHFWTDGTFQRMFSSVLDERSCPLRRAALLAQRFRRVFRVGEKLATMFVSALSVPALAPGLTPWFPEIDGSDLLVVDTNVIQAVDALSDGRAKPSYEGYSSWIRARAASLDLRQFRSELPGYSPRLVQQAIYTYRSRSNRIAFGDRCSPAATRTPCVRDVCPFCN